MFAYRALIPSCLIRFTNVNFQIRHPPTLSPGRVHKLPNYAFSSTQPPSYNHRFFCKAVKVILPYRWCLYINIYIYIYIYIYMSLDHMTHVFSESCLFDTA